MSTLQQPAPPYATVALTDSENNVYHAEKASKDEPWEISYPGGAQRFAGSKAQVTSLMKKIIRDVERQLVEDGGPEVEEDSGHATESFSGG